MSIAALSAALSELRDALAAARFPLTLPGSAEAVRLAGDQVRQLDDYVLPRLAALDAPLLCVVGGSTGAGKSTLVNSLLGRVVSRPGVIRPTTRSAVLVHHPDDAPAFGSDRILPGLGRTREPSTDTAMLQLVSEPSLPRGLAILDAPDVDSVVSENRALAAQLLAAADLWLFVTSAARYADAVPWDYLRSAADRAAAVAVVLDRVPPAAMMEVPPHLGRLMSDRGLGSSPLFAVPETSVNDEGLLPDAAVSPIRSWLAALAADQASRQAVMLQTLDGAITSLATWAPDVAAALDAQGEALRQLRIDADASYAEANRTIGVQTADGTLLRGEVLSRWQDFVGTGEFMRTIEKTIGSWRDKLMSAVRGESANAREVELAVESGLESLVISEGEAAAERTDSAWRAHPAGRQLIAVSGVDVSRASESLPDEVARAIRDWQGDVLELVSEVGASKRTTARYLALGVNGVGVALMVVVFSQTGGLTGAEVGVAGGTAVLAQRLLEAVFGEDAVRRLTTRAKEQLDARVAALLDPELARYHRLLADTGVGQARAEAIRVALARLQGSRADASAELGADTTAEQVAVQGGARATLGAGEEAAVEGIVLDPVDEATVEGMRVEVDRG
ncbi:MAG: ABC transporter [Propioniciclava sp.]